MSPSSRSTRARPTRLAWMCAWGICVSLSADGWSAEQNDKRPASSDERALGTRPATDDDDYIVVVTDKDTPLDFYHKYLDGAEFWREVTEHNLLREGVRVMIPGRMLKSEQIPTKISSFTGNVEIARSFDWEWVPAVPDMLVQQGDWVRTRAKSSAELRQDDGTLIALRPNTTIILETNGRLATAGGVIRKTELRLEQGSLFSRVETLVTPESRFVISTPVATSYIHGTECRVKVEREGATRLEVFEGRVDFGDENRQVSVESNFGALVTAEGRVPWQPHGLPPPPVKLSSPTNRQVLTNDLSSHDFVWTSIGRAVLYHLEVSTDAEFKNLVDEIWVEGSSTPLASVFSAELEPGTFFWRVSAVDDKGYESAWSSTSEFIYPPKLP
ncbi:MAG TPA: FecR family protein [Vicinamibacteria bacterium]|nr:FecR family protein [Vicinamibacteria bacterium]